MLEFAFSPLMVPLWQTALSFKSNTPKSLADAARLLIERRGVEHNQPIFVFINLMGVHMPYAARYVQRFNSDVFGWMAPIAGMDEPHTTVLSTVYDAEVVTQDAHVGRFLNGCASMVRLIAPSLAQSLAAVPARGAVFSEAEPAQNMLSIMRQRRRKSTPFPL